MTVTWLHVSDIHLKVGDKYDRDVVLRALLKSVGAYRAKGRVPDLIFATGDIGYSGKADEYKLADAFFDDLLQAAGLGRRDLFVVPGNHDVDLARGIGLKRTLTQREADDYFRPGDPNPHIILKQASFVDWYDRYFVGIRTFPTDTTCGHIEIPTVRDTTIGILPINSSLFALGGDGDYRKLLIARRCLDDSLKELTSKKVDLRVALLHHPLDWLTTFESGRVKAKLQGSVDVVLRGHLHENQAERVETAEGAVLYLAAGASYEESPWPRSALYTTFDRSALTVFPIRYEDTKTEVWTVDPSLFPERDIDGYSKTFIVPRLAGPAPSRPEPTPLLPPTPAAPAAQAAPSPGTGLQTNIPALRQYPVVGRDELIERIHEDFRSVESQGLFVLHGVSGVGKSEVAREYARRYAKDYGGGTYFLDGRAGSLPTGLASLGSHTLGLTFAQDLPLQDKWLTTLASLWPRQALLIYDDVTDQKAIEEFLPPAGMPCRVLVTTLMDNWEGRPHSERVDPLTDDIVLELIEAIAGKEVRAARGKEIATYSGGLPLQICPLATQLRRDFQHGHPSNSALTIAPEASQRFKELVDRLDDRAQLLLVAAAFLDGQHIRRTELRQHMVAVGWTDAEFTSALDACLGLHFFDGGDEMRMHSIHAGYLLAGSNG